MSANSGNNPILNWPEPCLSSTYQPTLRLSILPADVKSLVWSDLKKNNPAKANCLLRMSRDETVKQLITELGASLTLTKEGLSLDAYYAVQSYFE